MRRVAALLLLASLLAGVASGATIYLKGGGKVEGEILSRNDKEIKVKLASGKTQTISQADVKSIDEPIPPAPKAVSNETGDAPVDKHSKDFERQLGSPLAVSLTELAVVRGDHPVEDLKKMSEAVEKTARHFLATFECKSSEALRGSNRYGPTRIEIFQFWEESGYLAFCDKVLARVRDDTVDDARLAFMKRQRGLWITSPSSMMAQYQGPSDLVTSISAACHKTSHVMLTGWKPAGAFVPWWFYEGFASWQEFFVLGETRTYCLELARPAGYTRPGTAEADEAAKAQSEQGWRAKVKELVRARNEREFSVLCKMQLNEIVLVDVQQSWSVVDWLHQTGHLKDFATAYKETRDLDAACRQVLSLPMAGAQDAWREWVKRRYAER